MKKDFDRTQGIGGSDIPVIMGLSKYKTPYKLFLEKVGDVKPDDQQTEPQYWGHALESVIANRFIEDTDLVVSYPDTKRHYLHDFLYAHVDGFIEETNEVLEIKTAHAYTASKWGEKDSDFIPTEYLLQIAYYCMILNAKGAHLCVLIGGNDYRHYYYKKDKELERRILEEALSFWDGVQNNTAPNACNRDDLEAMYEPKESSVKSNDDIFEPIANLLEIKNEIKQLKEKQTHCEFKIQEYMKDNELLVNNDDKVIASWKKDAKGKRRFLFKGCA